MLSAKRKTAADRLDYDVSFDKWLPDGDIILSVVASASSTSGTVEIDDTVVEDDTVKVWVLGGTAGETATISVTITTQGGRTKKACFKLRITDC